MGVDVVVGGSGYGWRLWVWLGVAMAMDVADIHGHTSSLNEEQLRRAIQSLPCLIAHTRGTGAT